MLSPTLSTLSTSTLAASPLLLLLVLLPPLPYLLHHIHADYRAFKSLGPGGTPQTPLGYLRIKLLSLFALRDPRTPAAIPPTLVPQAGQLRSLAARAGPRPCVVGIAPHRQTTQRAPAGVFGALGAAMDALAADPARRLVTGTSCFEKHGPGLFSAAPATRSANCAGEVCHAHPSDGSLHLTLHPADARLVIERGWGERHPLARGGWLSRFVPGGFVMVYAPRDEREVEVVGRIVEAAVWWVGGVDVRAKGDEEKARGSMGVAEGCQMPGLVQKA